MLNEMFVMQHELNKIIGRDTLHDPLKENWFFQYAFAALEEVGELYDSDDKHEQCVELIDIYHFWISICHILNITPEMLDLQLTTASSKYGLSGPIVKQFFSTIETSFRSKEDHLLFNSTILTSWRMLDTLLNQCAWKWWAHPVKGVPEAQFKFIVNREKAIQITLEFYKPLLFMSWYLSMSLSDVFEVYKKKHKVNIDRQNSGYDVRTKTEADNQAIIADLKN